MTGICWFYKAGIGKYHFKEAKIWNSGDENVKRLSHHLTL